MYDLRAINYLLTYLLTNLLTYLNTSLCSNNELGITLLLKRQECVGDIADLTISVPTGIIILPSQLKSN